MVKNLLKKIIWVLFHAFYIFPINGKKIFFESFNGKQMSCNPLYVYIGLKNLKEKYGTDYKFVWSLNRADLWTEKKVKYVKHCSIGYLCQILTSKVVVVNDYVPLFIPFRKQQCVINAWHGGSPYKRATPMTSKQIKNKKKYASCLSYFLSSSKKFSEIIEKDFFIQKEKILEIGMPRKDLFFNRQAVKAIKEQVLAELQLPENAIVVLYAPTYREIEGKYYFNLTLDFDKLYDALEKRFGKKPVILFRGHHTFSKFLKNVDFDNKKTTNVTDYSDVQKLLCLTDIMIADYSSIVWDFALTGKPILLYADDLEQYTKEEGFYVYPNDWGFPLATTNAELCNNILNLDFEKSLEADRLHTACFGSFENGTATNEIIKIINAKLKI